MDTSISSHCDKFNYVIISRDAEWCRIMYDDLLKLPNVHCHYGKRVKSKFLKFLHYVHHQPRLNKYFDLPFQSLWYKTYFDADFDTPRPLCFIVDMRWTQYSYMRNFLKWLKSRYPGSTFVGYYVDLMYSYPSPCEPKNIRSIIDLLITYDIDEAKKFNIKYFPTSFSAPDEMMLSNYNVEPCDVYFLGKAKERLQQIYDIYDRLSGASLKCEFFITGVDPHLQRHEPGLHYITRMNYFENLAHVKASRCVLEAQQVNATGLTLRTWEAINYGKMLLTNNISLKSTPFYIPDSVTFITDSDKFDTARIIDFNPHVNQEMKHLLSPLRLLEFIESTLTKQ